VAMSGLTERLLGGHAATLSDEGRRLLQRLHANAERQDMLLADLLTLSRAGQEISPPQEVDVTVLVRQVLDETLREHARGPVKVTVSDSLGTLVARASDLRTIFGHLLANAVTFMGDEPAPEIEVAGVVTEDHVEFAVRDNGRGIDPAYHAKVFELFERLDAAEGRGTGVGLTIVRRVVESVGGRVWLDSEPGRGSTFRFTVPRVWPTPAAAD